MKSSLEKIQRILDEALDSQKIRVYWNKRTETHGSNKNEYVIYTFGGGDKEEFADDMALIGYESLTIKYYYSKLLADNKAGRSKVLSNIELIYDSLSEAGLEVSTPVELGDINNNGFYAVLIECEDWSVL